MENLFTPADRAAIERRLAALRGDSARQWGKMDVGQMLAHCATALEMACGDRQKKQALLGKIVTPFIRGRLLGEAPFGRNAPTDPDLVMTGQPRDIETERQRLAGLVAKFCDRGPEAAGDQVHSFFGTLNGQEWGRLMYKHLDHHLRQFGV